MSEIWIILGFISVGCLAFYFSAGKNAVWGTFTLGTIIGLISVFFVKEGFDFDYVLKAGIVGTLVGVGFELLGRLGDRLKR